MMEDLNIEIDEHSKIKSILGKKNYKQFISLLTEEFFDAYICLF